MRSPRRSAGVFELSLKEDEQDVSVVFGEGVLKHINIFFHVVGGLKHMSNTSDDGVCRLAFKNLMFIEINVSNKGVPLSSRKKACQRGHQTALTGRTEEAGPPRLF